MTPGHSCGIRIDERGSASRGAARPGTSCGIKVLVPRIGSRRCYGQSCEGRPRTGSGGQVSGKTGGAGAPQRAASALPPLALSAMACSTATGERGRGSSPAKTVRRCGARRSRSKVVLQRALEAAGKGLDARPVHQHAGLAVDDRFAGAAVVERHDRRPAGLGLDRHDAEIFGAWKQRRARRAIELADLLVRLPAQELDTAAGHAVRSRARSGPVPTIRSGTPTRRQASMATSRRLYGTSADTIRKAGDSARLCRACRSQCLRADTQWSTRDYSIGLILPATY